MRPVSRTLTDASGGVKNSDPIVLDYYGRPEVALQIVVTGTVNYTVQQTLDNPLKVAAASITWFDHPDSNLVAATANKQGNYAYLPTATRIKLNSGTGTVVFTATQAGLHP